MILFSLEFASLAILIVEPEVSGANILTASDALWWSFVSITTVGYGDLYPVSDAGRVIGALLLAVGVGLFSVLTSNLAKNFISPRRRRKQLPVGKPKGYSHGQLEQMKHLLAEQSKANAELQTKLQQLEDLL